MKPPLQLPYLCVDPSREPDLGLLSRLGPLPAPHVPVLDVLLIVLDLLDDVVVQRIQRSLESDVGKVREVAHNRNQEGRGPIDRGRGEDLQEDPEGVHFKGVLQLTVDEEEEVPRGHAGDDEDMLDPCKVAHCQRDLDVDGPDYASHHGSSNGRQVGCLAPDTESLVVEDDDVEEEYDEGSIEAVSHPSKYS